MRSCKRADSDALNLHPFRHRLARSPVNGDDKFGGEVLGSTSKEQRAGLGRGTRTEDLPGAFTYSAYPARVVFGSGSLARLPDEIDRLPCRRALVLCTPEQAAHGERVLDLLTGRGVGAFADAAPHTPTDVTANATALVEGLSADCLVSIGGGSAVGLGKAIALRLGLPHVAVPTTYAGSEATPILGQTESGRKTTQRSPRVLPSAIIYDVDLTLGLPVPMSIASGLNAIAHAAEALYARDRDPVTSMMAEAAIAAIAGALSVIAVEPGDVKARARALYGAWLAGTCLGAVGMALHHKLCHVLGGRFDLPHAQTHAVVLPHVLAYNRRAAPDAMRRIARAIGADDAAQGIYGLTTALTGGPLSLASLGMPEAGIADAAAAAAGDPYWNPEPIDRSAIGVLLARAYAGEPPGTGV